MQDVNGKIVPIGEFTFEKAIEANANARVCKVGDVFNIRTCTFEVTDITGNGIKAKGISRAEWMKKMVEFKRQEKSLRKETHDE